MAAKQLFTGEPNELYDTKTREVMIDVNNGAGLIVGLRVDVSLHAEEASVTRLSEP